MVTKLKLLKKLSGNYPNFLKKDLEKFTNIVLNEINPKTGEKVNTPEKKTIHFKMAKELFKKLNNEK